MMRLYQGLDDLQRMKNLLTEILLINPHSAYHPGDLDWRLFTVAFGYDPQTLIRLWEDKNGNLLGWLFVYPGAGMFDFVVAPSISGSDMEAQMLVEVEAYVSTLYFKDRQHLGMFMFADDMSRRRLLEDRGYSGKECRVHLAHSLIRQSFEPKLPDGFRFLNVREADYAERRAAVHVDAFNPGSTMTAEKYRYLMQAPGYNPDLDVVIVAPDGRFAAFALAWIDWVSKIGVFEPVGTAVEFQKLGLGKATLHEAMRRMQTHGIETATVVTSLSQGVVPFYQAVGFQIMNTIQCYEPFILSSQNP
jgi:mycothiol synthase